MNSLIKFNNRLVNPKRIDYIQKLDPRAEGVHRIILSVGGNCLYEYCDSKETQEIRYQELIKQIENA